jgi:gamma-glutamyl:cysteine ligase YbdK (ATP-grasp superfamily)
MTAHPFWEMLGLDDVGSEDRLAVLEQKAAQLTEKMQRILAIMVRCRQAIERCRCEIERHEKQVKDLSSQLASPTQARMHALATERLQRSRHIHQKHEAAYQRLLARADRTKQTLAEIQSKLRSHRPGPR